MEDNGSEKETEGLKGQKNQQELLLDKIRFILKSTDPERWKKGGNPIDPDDRFEKPRQTWEMVYSLEIPAGVLVLRSSTPLRSEFAGRGFLLAPIADELHTVEIRAPGWHHSELTDPFKRSRISDRRCTVLAEGEIAKSLYDYVETAYSNFHDARQQTFNKEVYNFILSLPKRLKEETLANWERSEDTPGEIHYSALVNDYEIDVVRTFLHEREHYEINVAQHTLKSKIKEVGLAKELFAAVEEAGQTSRLMTLSKALEQL